MSESDNTEGLAAELEGLKEAELNGSNALNAEGSASAAEVRLRTVALGLQHHSAPQQPTCMHACMTAYSIA